MKNQYDMQDEISHTDKRPQLKYSIILKFYDNAKLNESLHINCGNILHKYKN